MRSIPGFCALHKKITIKKEIAIGMKPARWNTRPLLIMLGIDFTARTTIGRIAVISSKD